MVTVNLQKTWIAINLRQVDAEKDVNERHATLGLPIHLLEAGFFYTPNDSHPESKIAIGESLKEILIYLNPRTFAYSHPCIIHVLNIPITKQLTSIELDLPQSEDLKHGKWLKTYDYAQRRFVNDVGSIWTPVDSFPTIQQFRLCTKERIEAIKEESPRQHLQSDETIKSRLSMTPSTDKMAHFSDMMSTSGIKAPCTAPDMTTRFQGKEQRSTMRGQPKLSSKRRKIQKTATETHDDAAMSAPENDLKAENDCSVIDNIVNATNTTNVNIKQETDIDDEEEEEEATSLGNIPVCDMIQVCGDQNEAETLEDSELRALINYRRLHFSSLTTPTMITSWALDYNTWTSYYVSQIEAPIRRELKMILFWCRWPKALPILITAVRQDPELLSLQFLKTRPSLVPKNVRTWQCLRCGEVVRANYGRRKDSPTYNVCSYCRFTLVLPSRAINYLNLGGKHSQNKVAEHVEVMRHLYSVPPSYFETFWELGRFDYNEVPVNAILEAYNMIMHQLKDNRIWQLMESIFPPHVLADTTIDGHGNAVGVRKKFDEWQ